jgi:hypothetical protein
MPATLESLVDPSGAVFVLITQSIARRSDLNEESYEGSGLAGEKISMESILRLRLKKPQLEILKSTLAQHVEDKVSTVQTVHHHAASSKAPQDT